MHARARSGFSLVELAVTLLLVAIVMGGAYFALSTGQSASQKGVVILDEVSKQIRLTEQLRRVLRTATTVVHTPSPAGAVYDITYVSRIDEAGPTLVTERARLELTTKKAGGLLAVFLREGQKAVKYPFLDMLMDIEVGPGNAVIRFTSPRSSSSLQLACANLLPSGIPLDPVLRPGPLPSAPAAPPPFGPMGLLGASPASASPDSGTAPRGNTPSDTSGPAGQRPASMPVGDDPLTNLARQPASGVNTPFGGMAAAGAGPGPEDQGITSQGTRPGLPPMRQGRPGDIKRKPAQPTGATGWTGLDPRSPGAGRTITPTGAVARPGTPKTLRPAGTAAAAAGPAERVAGDELQAVTTAGSVDEPF